MTLQPERQPRLSRRAGQAISEYMILIALISVGSIAVLQVLSHNLRARLATVAENLRGKHDSKINGKQVEAEDYRIRDLGDFQEGIQENDSK